MGIKGQDILVLLKLAARGHRQWKYAELADELEISASEVHAAGRHPAIQRRYGHPQVFGHLRLPMASPSILAGIKTGAVINVGTREK